MEFIVEEREGEQGVGLHHILTQHDARLIGRCCVVDAVLFGIYLFGKSDVLRLFDEVFKVLEQRSFVVETLYVCLEALEGDSFALVVALCGLGGVFVFLRDVDNFFYLFRPEVGVVL